MPLKLAPRVMGKAPLHPAAELPIDHWGRGLGQRIELGDDLLQLHIMFGAGTGCSRLEAEVSVATRRMKQVQRFPQPRAAIAAFGSAQRPESGMLQHWNGLASPCDQSHGRLPRLQFPRYNSSAAAAGFASSTSAPEMSVSGQTVERRRPASLMMFFSQIRSPVACADSGE